MLIVLILDVFKDLALKEKQEQEKKDQLKKKVASDCKIQEWLQIKREQVSKSHWFGFRMRFG